MDNYSNKLSIIQRRGLPQLKISINIFLKEKKIENKSNLKVTKKPRLSK